MLDSFLPTDGWFRPRLDLQAWLVASVALGWASVVLGWASEQARWAVQSSRSQFLGCYIYCLRLLYDGGRSTRQGKAGRQAGGRVTPGRRSPFQGRLVMSVEESLFSCGRFSSWVNTGR